MSNPQYNDIIKLKEYFKILDSDDIHLIKNEDKSIEQPSNIKLELKNYQKATIYQMFLREQKNGFFIDKYNFWATNIGILGESVGIGKTYITLGLIAHKPLHKFYYAKNPSRFVRYQLLKHKWGLENVNEQFIKNLLDYIPCDSPGINVIDDFYLRRPRDLYMHQDKEINYNKLEELRSNLIVVPHNLLKQWLSDIKENTNLTCFSISNIRHLKAIKDDPRKLGEYDIILCNASKYNDLMEMTKKFIWERVFFDEAHSINIPTTRYVAAKFYWFITATYKSIISRRNTGFLRTLFLNYGRKLTHCSIYNFNKFILRTCNKSVKKEFVLSPPEKFYHLSEKPIWVDLLENCIDTSFERLKEMLYGEAIKEFKQYIHNFYYHNSISINEVLSKNPVLLYLRWLNYRIRNYTRQIDSLEVELTELREFITTTGYTLSTSRTRKISEQSLTRKTKYKEKLERWREYSLDLRKKLIRNLKKRNLCWLCLNTYTAFYNVNCNNACGVYPICKDCYKDKIKHWRELDLYWSNQCLNCNDGEMLFDNKAKLFNEVEIETKYKTKFEHLCEIIEDKSKRILVFSSYSELFDKFKTQFRDKGIKYGVLKGNHNTINKRMRDFKSGSVRILLLNSRFYGSGLNLQDATDIIITHKITKDMETQVVGRANRMGRKGILKIHYLIFEGELH